MKSKLIFILLCSVVFISCTKEGVLTEYIDNTSNTNSIILKNGMFTPTSGITVAGNAELRMNNTEKFIKLNSFNVSTGPDLKVYLSKSNLPNDFINLGPLLSNKFIYTIPNGIDINAYAYVLIHCQQYNHLFAIAKLK